MKYQNKNLEFVTNIDDNKKVAIMLLFGQIGKNLNGDNFAQEMVFLSEIGFRTIKISVNSVGGSIRQGMSIINAMNIVRMGGTSVETNIVGVADSMAGMISAFGDRGKRTVANFGSAIVHEPLVEDEDGNLITIDELPDGDLKTELLSMKDVLVTLLSSSTGKSKSDVKKIMKEGKRLKSSEMRTFGMVDKVVVLSNEKVDIKNKTAIELMVACSEIKTEIQTKTKTMKDVNKILNLTEDANESSAVNSIEALQNSVSGHKTEMDKKNAEILKLEDEKEVLVNSAKEVADATAEAYVDTLINSGKLNKENRDALVNQAKENFDGFKTITESLQVEFVDVTKQIDKSQNTSTDDGEKLAKEYHGHMVAGTLVNLEKDSPSKFQKLEDAYMKSSTNFDD